MLSQSSLRNAPKYRTQEGHRVTLLKAVVSGEREFFTPHLIDDSHFERTGIDRMKVYRYGERYGTKLKALVESFSSIDGHNIEEEMTHVRLAHADVVARYDAVLDATFPDTEEGRAGRTQALHLAGSMLKDSADDVLKAVERSAKIIALTADKLHPAMLDSAIRQLIGFMYQCFDAEDPAMAGRMEAFEKAVNEHLQLPSLKKAAQGTTITPDQQVQAMDALVPFVPTEE